MAALNLGPLHFETKAHAGGFLRELKDREPGTEFWLDPTDAHSKKSQTYKALLSALDRHPDRDLYPRESPTFFSVTECPVYHQNRLTAHWHYTGKEVRIAWRFSYRRCISPYPRKHQIRRAFWREVVEQLLARQSLGRCHVVHDKEKDLDLLIETFLELQKIPQDKRTPKELLKPKCDIPFLKDRGIAAEWREFHATNAQLLPMTCDEYVLYVKEDRDDVLLGVNP